MKAELKRQLKHEELKHDFAWQEFKSRALDNLITHMSREHRQKLKDLEQGNLFLLSVVAVLLFLLIL